MKQSLTAILVASLLLLPMERERYEARAQTAQVLFVISLTVIGASVVIYLTYKYPREGTTRWFVLETKKEPFGPKMPWVPVATNALRIVPDVPFPAFYQMARENTNYIFRVVEIEQPPNYTPQYNPNSEFQAWIQP